MTTFLFLQRFENGRPVSVPCAKVVAVLERHGKAGRGRGDLEFTFEPDTIASGCTIVGNAEAGVECIGFERPRYDQGLRRVVWDCMKALDCTAFNDTLGPSEVPTRMASSTCTILSQMVLRGLQV